MLSLVFCYSSVKIVSIVLSLVIVGINIYFVAEQLIELDLDVGWQVLIYLGTVLYFLFIVYISVHMYISMGNTNLENNELIQKYVYIPIVQSGTNSA